MKNILLYYSFSNVGTGHRVSFPPVWNTRIYVHIIFITWDKGTCHPSYYIIIIIIATVTAEHGRISRYNTYKGTYHIHIRVPRVLETVTSPINRKPYTNATAHAHAHTRVCSQTVF